MTRRSDINVIELRGTDDRPRTRRRFTRSAAARPSVAGIDLIPAARVASRRDRTFRWLLAGADALAAVVVIAAVVGVRDLLPLSLLLPVLVVLTNKVVGLYDRDDTALRRSTLAEVPRLGEISGLLALLIWMFADGLLRGDLDRTQVLTVWVGVFAATAGARMIARAIARRITGPERCAVVGDAASIRRIEHKLAISRVRADVVATLKLTYAAQPVDPPGPKAFADWLARNGVERLVLAPLGTGSGDGLDYVRVAKAAGVRVSLLPRMLEVVGSSVEFEDVDGMTVLGVRSFGLSRSSQALKRGFDLVGATIGLLAVSPLLLAIALAVRLGSRGPVLFRQERVGKDGVAFEMYKFRSMVDGADALKASMRRSHPADDLFKLADDPRVTPVGRLLRRTSLDELPQLFNVLRGQMSLVGPRPLIAEEDALISGIDRLRLHLVPGMTGPWQILGSARVPLREMVAMDYLYVANWSLWRDVEILLRTVVHMLRRGGM